jgi:ATP-dependent DNA ligase
MEAKSVADAPQGDQWQYEPKWDGFRSLAFRNGDDLYLQSRSGKPFARYFPDLVAALLALPATSFVLDGEIVIPVKGRLSFDDLLLRIHPAASRVRRLAAEFPATYIVFDLLADETGASLLSLPLAERRQRLERFAADNFAASASIRLSPSTTDVAAARRWFKSAGNNLDGIIAKRRDMPYRSGERDAMVKVKQKRTADCVVAGFRYAEKQRVVGSLLLGLYTEDGLLDHVGFCASFNAAMRTSLTKRLVPLIGPPGFTGRAPGGPSRWSTRRSTEWEPLKPRLVVEVEYDQFTGGRFRHGTHFLRWRPDKPPKKCTLDQVTTKTGVSLKMLEPHPRARHLAK